MDPTGRAPHDAGWAALDAADAIVFGSPTCFGSLSSEGEGLLRVDGRPLGRWAALEGQAGAGFTNFKTMSGDKLNTLFDLAAFASQHGMIWVGLDLYPGWHTKDGTPDELNRLGSCRAMSVIERS